MPFIFHERAFTTVHYDTAVSYTRNYFVLQVYFLYWFRKLTGGRALNGRCRIRHVLFLFFWWNATKLVGCNCFRVMIA